MSCRYSCICGGNCLTCNSSQREQYFGEAEDLLSQQMGYNNYDEHMQYLRQSKQQEEDEYYKQQEEEYREQQMQSI